MNLKIIISALCLLVLLGASATAGAQTGNGLGDDSIWKVSCEDCEAGTKVIIDGVEGVVLSAAITD